MTLLPSQQAVPPADYDEPYNDAPDSGRRPPYDLDAERTALAGMMFSPQAVMECEETLQAEDYYLPAHQTLHSFMVARYAKGLPNDWRLLGDALEQEGLLHQAGGRIEIMKISNAFETGATARHYAEIVHRNAVFRRLAAAGVAIAQTGFSCEGTVDEVLAEAAGQIATVAEGATSSDKHDFVLPADALPAALLHIEQARTGGISGIATGFTDLDALTQGLQPGQLIVIAGRPGMGKSTLAMDIARNCSINNGVPSAFISLEMPTTELMLRLISAQGRVGLHHLRSGYLSETDMANVANALPGIQAAQLHINDSEKTYSSIQSKLRRAKAKHPDLGLIVLDYLQLMRLGGRRPESREKEVAEMSSSLKMLAKELGVPIVALAQLNRGPEMRTDKKPVASDLRESGAIEQDADLIILLHREDAYEAESKRAGEADLIVAKHRNGPTATITVAFQGHYSRFCDMAQT
ncbi:replicative DNA helicase [Streptomyces sp. NPDC053705]|uniref:replicative DNA helicase n=1 Tax=Streptomyces sp. NPDC053705 TaxID=3156668 RepID=UPI0034251794